MEPVVVRQCGTIEQWSTSRHAFGIYTGIANSCQYVIADHRLQGRPAETIVEEALSRLILRLGGLRVGIIKENTNQASFVGVKSMNLKDFIEWKTVAASSQAQYDAQVLEMTKDRLEQLWPDTANRPPWKLLVVQNNALAPGKVVLDMVFATHHALSDGKSTMVFHTGLLHELNSCSAPPAELKSHILSFDQPPSLAPPQQELIQFNISWAFFLKTLWNEFGPSWLKSTPPIEPWRGKAITLEAHRLKLRLMTIKPEVVTDLVTACRAHGATLTAIIHVLVLVSVTRHVPAEVARAFSSETPIGLLPWAKPSPVVNIDLQAMLSVLNTSANKVWDADTVADLRRRLREADEGLEEHFIWPLAATWRAETKTKIASLPNDDVCGLMDYVTDWQKRWQEKIGTQRDATWEVSNIGLIKGSSNEGQGAWAIQRSFFAQPAFLAGPAFGVNVTGVEGAGVTLTLNWQDGVIDDAIVDGVVEDLSAWLEEFRLKGKFRIIATLK
ncbi:Alcohol acetyltransferase [Diaporthe australafricana]|uniref:Alcohol acetyltransferase n=1 Tax=Diaporthe australafricana TaxID=127596 RepID=A0ABR3WZI4_9PEZI